jgi:hypothetical protein
MKRAILIHGWEENPNGQWLPWLKEKLESDGWKVEVPEMPNTKKPTLSEWMKTLTSLSPDENTVLIGHSLANALILKYVEQTNTKLRASFCVAAWDWLLEAVREFHITFFENGFDYERIKEKRIPITIINSTTDPWIDFERSKLLARKLDSIFLPVENAGHFMSKDGYTEFPLLLSLIK